jgi:hypothetical protein
VDNAPPYRVHQDGLTLSCDRAAPKMRAASLRAPGTLPPTVDRPFDVAPPPADPKRMGEPRERRDMAEGDQDISPSTPRLRLGGPVGVFSSDEASETREAGLDRRERLRSGLTEASRR